MLKLIQYTCFAFVLLLTSSSCASLFYPNNDHQIVAPSEKGGLQLAGGLRDTYDDGEQRPEPAFDKRYAFGVQAGYSPIKHLSLIANYYEPIGVPGSSELDVGYVGYSADLAIGGYWGKRTPHIERGKEEELDEYYVGDSDLFMNYDEWFFDAYVGRGKGDMKLKYFFTGDKSLDFDHTFLQGGIHWRSSKIGLDLSNRLLWTKFNKVTLAGAVPSADLKAAERLRASPTQLSIKTTFRIQMGTSFARLYLERNWHDIKRDLDHFYFEENKYNLRILFDIHGFINFLK